MLKSTIFILSSICALTSAQYPSYTTLPPGPSVSGSSFECLTPYYNMATPGIGCYLSRMDFSSLDEQFQFTCGARGACVGTNMMFNTDVKRIGKIECSEEYACYQADMRINGDPSNPVTVDKLNCAGPGACQDMKIWLMHADIGEIKCSIGSCQGCVIYEHGAGVGKPCQGW